MGVGGGGGGGWDGVLLKERICSHNQSSPYF